MEKGEPMRRAPLTKKSHKQPSKRIAALAFLMCFVMVSLLSEVFFLTHTSHEHDHLGGGSCVVCAHIQSAESLLRRFIAVSGGVLFGLVNLFAAIAGLDFISALFRSQTLIALKMRMNS